MNAQDAPNTIVLSLQPPAAICISTHRWYPLGEQICQFGYHTEQNDTPWNCVADLLIESRTRSFAGLAFRIVDELDECVARHVVGRLNHDVARYTVWPTERDQSYGGGSPGIARCDIAWISMRRLEWLRGDLCFSHWCWLYQLGFCDFAERDVLGLAICHVDEILAEHGLNFPAVPLPPLPVEFLE